jgi:uncharacterized protein YjiS (DUF1127 family)
MSSCSPEKMINNHEYGFLTGFSQRLNVWSNRWRQRHELAQWTDRDLHDVGLSWSDIAREVEKPFWRA